MILHLLENNYLHESNHLKSDHASINLSNKNLTEKHIMKDEKFRFYRFKELKKIKPRVQRKIKYEIYEYEIPISKYNDENKFWSEILAIKFEWEI